MGYEAKKTEHCESLRQRSDVCACPLAALRTLKRIRHVGSAERTHR
jgi:hypothetical protein